MLDCLDLLTSDHGRNVRLIRIVNPRRQAILPSPSSLPLDQHFTVAPGVGVAGSPDLVMDLAADDTFERLTLHGINPLRSISGQKEFLCLASGRCKMFRRHFLFETLARPKPKFAQPTP